MRFSACLPYAMVAFPIAAAIAAVPQAGFSAGYQALHTFGAVAGGTQPDGQMTLGSDGNLYGTTASGGLTSSGNPSGYGTIYKVSPSGTFQTIYSFTGLLDGASPNSLVLDTNGSFVGTACGGGSTVPTGYAGTVFRLTTDGTLTVLHAFSGADGLCPAGPVVIAADGTIFGLTAFGGTNVQSGTLEGGTLYEIAPDGTETTLYSFNSNSGSTDGFGPDSGLIVGPDGNYYGSTEQGGTGSCEGSNQCGTLFRVTPQGQLTFIHNFQSGAGGWGPAGPLAVSGKSLVGTTLNGGGSDNVGVVFRFNLETRKETVLHTFDEQEGTDFGGVVVSHSGTIYGATIGFMFTNGELFQLSPTGTETVLQALSGETAGSLALDQYGRVYGTTETTLFRYTPTKVQSRPLL